MAARVAGNPGPCFLLFFPVFHFLVKHGASAGLPVAIGRIEG
jgi:hypothetical protein